MKNPYMPLWVNDYLMGTRLMSLEEQGLYIRIILELWTCGEMPADPVKASKLLGINSRSFKRIFELIRHKFTVQNGLISHSRVDEERLKMISKSEKARENGKKGGIAKANARNSLEQKPSYSDSNSNTYSNTLKEKQEKEKAQEPATALATAVLKLFPKMKTVNSWCEKQLKTFSQDQILEEVENAHEWKSNQTGKKANTANPTSFLTNWLKRTTPIKKEQNGALKRGTAPDRMSVFRENGDRVDIPDIARGKFEIKDDGKDADRLDAFMRTLPNYKEPESYFGVYKYE